MELSHPDLARPFAPHRSKIYVVLLSLPLPSPSHAKSTMRPRTAPCNQPAEDAMTFKCIDAVPSERITR